MAGEEKKPRRLFVRLIVPLLLIACLYLALLGLLLNLSGVLSALSTNALEMLDERTQNKQLSLQDDVSGNWTDMNSLAVELSATIRRTLSSHDATAADMQTDAALNADIVMAVAPTLLSQLRTASINGIFLILDGIGVAGQEGSYAGLYLRDSEPDTATADNTDVMLERGLPPVSRTLGLPLDSYWRAAFTFTDNDGSFFFDPMQAAASGASLHASDYGQWTGPFTLSANDSLSIVTYSVPLLDTEGQVLGVVGTEVTVSHLSSLLNKGELSRNDPGCYLLAATSDGQTFRYVASAGTLFRQQFDLTQSEVTAESWVDSNTMALTGSRSGEALYGSVYQLNWVNGSNASTQERWVVIGLQTVEAAMAFSNHFLHLAVLCCIAALALAAVIAFITSWRITYPVSNLIHKLQDSNMAQERLDTTGIQEIDILAQEIIRQSNSASIQSLRLNRVLSLTGTLIGVYEIRNDDENAFCSRGVFEAFDMVYDERLVSTISRARCRQMLDSKLVDEVDKNVFRVPVVGGGIRYLRHRQLVQPDCTLGTLIDVTTEMEYRYRVEYERDYDTLTGLLNRRAFASICHNLFTKQSRRLQTAVVIMMDLDNLKFLNDTYGHDTGDAYICCFASALNAFDSSACVYGRRSGDEFYALLYGWDNHDALEKFAQEKWQEICSTSLTLVDGSEYRVHVSGGMAWYPQDSTDFDTLIHYADYAMYRVKQGSKGVLASFDPTAYAEYAHMMSGREALNRLLDEKLVKYAFQPIVSTTDGSVMGYELLMRPQVPELSSPAAVLKLAKAQGMMHHIEHLTWMCSMETCQEMRQHGLLPENVHLFVNSIANQMLGDEEEEQVMVRYGDLLNRVVLEVTEGENNNLDYTRRKQEFVRLSGGLVAIDDFGTGYNSEVALMMIPCNYVKLDISFVRDVDTSPDKQAMVRNLISYAHLKDIEVICEGVETSGEMATLIAFGADYLQGYYLGRPAETPQPTSAEAKAKIFSLRNSNR